ncbi:transposase [Methylococcus capsulatus]|uniref:transposase n=1 Tax=Methylococcus capsulatus TaxID=414 RepID=UPI001C52E59E|nr:transposase [Methylococcus capsulatus]QXP88700.1 transposase [Methylococcus capsulatus]QXP94268.1 transposase [Methylococcus capsulatus]UQN10978.1 transposase [Methylococcus capsulatus]
MEYQVLDRLSFQRFPGLRRSSQVPYRTTFWSFRERLTAAQAGDTPFEAVNRPLGGTATSPVAGGSWTPAWSRFAAIDQMSGKLLRCIGLDRARFLLTGKAATYNPRRLCSLKACGVVAF